MFKRAKTICTTKNNRCGTSMTSTPSDPAGKSFRAVCVFLLIAGSAAATDLYSKHAVFEQLIQPAALAPQIEEFKAYNPNRPIDAHFTRAVLSSLHISRPVCDGLSLTISTNPGIVFGIDAIPRWVVNAVTVFAMIFVGVYFVVSPRRNGWLHVALALILGGAIGNLYDRLFSEVTLPGLPPIVGHVRDFIDCSDLHYDYVFNLADAYLVVGVGIIFLQWAIESLRSKKAQAQ
jgi:lipoprotein signal peptidase